jgi:hypothetical protein
MDHWSKASGSTQLHMRNKLFVDFEHLRKSFARAPIFVEREDFLVGCGNISESKTY